MNHRWNSSILSLFTWFMDNFIKVIEHYHKEEAFLVVAYIFILVEFQIRAQYLWVSLNFCFSGWGCGEHERLFRYVDGYCLIKASICTQSSQYSIKGGVYLLESCIQSILVITPSEATNHIFFGNLCTRPILCFWSVGINLVDCYTIASKLNIDIMISKYSDLSASCAHSIWDICVFGGLSVMVTVDQHATTIVR